MTDNQHQHPHRARRGCGSMQPSDLMRVRRRPDLVDPWRVVERRRSGLLRYARARGTLALPVRYAVWNHRVYMRLPAYNDACNFVDRADVALDVDASSAGRALIARVAGLGLVVPDSALPAELGESLEKWPADMPTRLVVLVSESLRQIPQADDARYPPLPDTDARLPGTFADPRTSSDPADAGPEAPDRMGRIAGNKPNTEPGVGVPVERQIDVEENGQLLAETTLSARDANNEMRAQVTPVPGHLPVGSRQKVADAVYEAVVADHASHLTVTVPLGDAELIDRIRSHLSEVELRAAGATCIIEGQVEAG